MKSVFEEAATVAKAIEKGWIKAGQPSKFSVSVLEKPEKNFLGMTKKPAKVGVFFEEEKEAEVRRYQPQRQTQGQSQGQQRRPQPRQGRGQPQQGGRRGYQQNRQQRPPREQEPQQQPIEKAPYVPRQPEPASQTKERHYPRIQPPRKSAVSSGYEHNVSTNKNDQQDKQKNHEEKNEAIIRHQKPENK